MNATLVCMDSYENTADTDATDHYDSYHGGFAVRWTLGYSAKDFNERMSRWHGSIKEGQTTYCGITVPIFNNGSLPKVYEWPDYADKINCKRCLKAMKGMRTGTKPE